MQIISEAFFHKLFFKLFQGSLITDVQHDRTEHHCMCVCVCVCVCV